MKYAIFVNPKLSWMELIYSEDKAQYTDMVRTTDWAEVTFVPRPAEEIVPAQVAALDVEIAEVTEKFAKELANLKARKSELLSICDQRETVE